MFIPQTLKCKDIKTTKEFLDEISVIVQVSRAVIHLFDFTLAPFSSWYKNKSSYENEIRNSWKNI